MWLKLLIYYLLIYYPLHGHVPDYLSTPATKIEQQCILAEACIHDTIPICGKNAENDKRDFLDLCDMLEYICDTNEFFTHIDDIPGCPVHKITVKDQ